MTGKMRRSPLEAACASHSNDHEKEYRENVNKKGRDRRNVQKRKRGKSATANGKENNVIEKRVKTKCDGRRTLCIDILFLLLYKSVYSGYVTDRTSLFRRRNEKGCKRKIRKKRE